ncbi:putative DNA-binding domain-containing protein [Propylenella binzhouense]|uniref:DUF2063 domain-containing protein n=1 Tax=Propylenella binzhouense TaxID=2555902 RepID=A0A964WU76_9HYPH|nr:DUF2063 domain-containing protein [Propylenella binzhouense]
MSPLADLQHGFVRALLDPDEPPPPGLAAGAAPGAERRFAVYRNNVAVGLVNALRAAYPAVERIVGEAFFAAAARAYSGTHFPARPVLIDYGEAFPEFLETFPPARRHRYLADVARLERARLAAYHAADRPPLPPARLAEVAPDALAGLVLVLHPSARVLRSRFPVLTVWSMNAGILDPAPVDFGRAEDVLVFRPDWEVEVRLLSPGAAVFVEALGRGCRLGEAAARAGGEPGFDLGAVLADCLSAGLFCDLNLGEEEEDR